MNALISIADGMSLAIIADIDYPIVEVTKDVAIIAATTSTSAGNIARRVGGDLVETPQKEFPYEIHIKLTTFDSMIVENKWSDVIRRYQQNN